MTEQIVTFGSHRRLVGILHQPPGLVQAEQKPAILLLNAGILHRVGPNRLYVTIARELAAQGHIVLRFDLFGIGDSLDRDGSGGSATFFDDTLEAMQLLDERLGATSFMLMGICMGARIALDVASRDPRVTGLVLMEGIYVKSLRYHLSRLLEPAKWARVLTGRNHKMMVLRRKLSKRLGSLRKGEKDTGGQRRDGPRLLDDREGNRRETLQALLKRNVRILLIFRDGNETAHNYRLVRRGDEIIATETQAGLTVRFIPFADHTFTPLLSQQLLLDAIDEWMGEAGSSQRPALRAAA
jgi:pimeloyl-ACP methyl ester carboxylesterase